MIFSFFAPSSFHYTCSEKSQSWLTAVLHVLLLFPKGAERGWENTTLKALRSTSVPLTHELLSLAPSSLQGLRHFPQLPAHSLHSPTASQPLRVQSQTVHQKQIFLPQFSPPE